MKALSLRIVLSIVVLLLVGNVFAAVTGASVSPIQRQLSGSSNNLFSVSWAVATDSGRSVVVTSSNASLSSGATSLGFTGIPFSSNGVGPFVFNESISISASQVSSWQSQNFNSVQLNREFIDSTTGTSVTATMNLLVPVRANFRAARVSPTQRQLFGAQDNFFNANWQVVADSGHSSGVVSSFARVINPANGSELSRINESLSASGSGPFLFSESIGLDATLVDVWINQGLRRVILERNFNDPLGGGSTQATMVLMLSRSNLQAARNSVTGGLSIQGLRLEFDTGNNLAVTTMDSPLKARLTVIHSGSGVLEGRWQIAEPGSAGGNPMYRTLSLVRKNLVANQRSIVQSPELPATRSGKYLMRFCVSNREFIEGAGLITDSQCPTEYLIVKAAYQVQALRVGSSSAVASIQGLSPNQQTVDATTPFNWPAVAGASSYQLQLFALASAEATLPSSMLETKNLEPRFVTGMVLPAASTSITLSKLVKIRLQANQRYLWRITAHDASGKVIAISAEPTFIYQPDK